MEKYTENKILLAAEEEFMIKGFAGSRTTAIAERAGVTHAMLHYYFRTKEKLFERIIAEKIRLIDNIVFQSLYLEDIPIEEVIKSVVEKHLVFLHANPNLPHFLIGELYNSSDRSAMLKERIGKIAGEVIRRFQKKIDSEAEKGNCIRIEAAQIILDIISLNLTPFLAIPLVDSVLGEGTVCSEVFLEMRKKSNFETIMKKLRP